MDIDKDYIILLVVPFFFTSCSSQFNSDTAPLNIPVLSLYLIRAVSCEYRLTQQLSCKTAPSLKRKLLFEFVHIPVISWGRLSAAHPAVFYSPLREVCTCMEEVKTFFAITRKFCPVSPTKQPTFFCKQWMQWRAIVRFEIVIHYPPVENQNLISSD